MISFRPLDCRTVPLVIAHRGAPTMAYENTLESFELAITQRADAVELDLRLTADNKLIVHHDPKITRALPPLSAMTLSTVRRESKARGFYLPALDEVLELARGRIAVNIELKETGLEDAALRAVKESHVLESILFSSFLPAAIARVKQSEPRAVTGLLLGLPRAVPKSGRRRPLSAAAKAAAVSADFLLPHKLRATKRFLRRLSRRGIPAIVWTVNAPRSYRRLIQQHVAGIITDRPDLLRRQFDRR